MQAVGIPPPGHRRKRRWAASCWAYPGIQGDRRDRALVAARGSDDGKGRRRVLCCSEGKSTVAPHRIKDHCHKQEWAATKTRRQQMRARAACGGSLGGPAGCRGLAAMAGPHRCLGLGCCWCRTSVKARNGLACVGAPAACAQCAGDPSCGGACRAAAQALHLASMVLASFWVGAARGVGR